MDKDSLNHRYEKAKDMKYRWLSLYQRVYDYVLPDRNAQNVLFNYDDRGRPVTQHIWDSTAMISAYQRANDMHSLLFPKDRNWAQLKLHERKHDEVTIESYNELVTNMNQNIRYHINNSNLHGIVSSSNLDLVAGTAVIWMESPSDDEPLYFRSIPALATFLEWTNDYVVKNCWFVNSLLGREILDKFPKYNGRLKKRLESSPDEHFQVIYGQIKKDEDQYYIYMALEDDQESFLKEKTVPYRQIIVYRDRVRPGETEGRGIGIDMLPTIEDLNRIVEYSRKNLAFKANPPMLYDSNIYLNPFSIQKWSGMMIPRSPGSRPIEALEMPEYAEVYKHIELLQNQIQKGFHVDPLGDLTDSVRSATEVSLREKRAQRTSATDLSRLINELPKTIYENAAIMLNERGLLTKQGQKIPKFNPRDYHFEFMSPLYDGQKEDNKQQLVQLMQTLQQFMGEGAVFTTFNLAKLKDYIQDNFNLPPDIFKTDAEFKQALQSLVQQAQQQKQPQPKTSAEQVQAPQQQNITI